MHKIFFGLLLLISLMFVPQSNQNHKSEQSKDVNGVRNVVIQKRETAKVVRAIDGDTIEIEGGRKVRYIGIDTPELEDKQGNLECFARLAYERNRELVEGKTIELEKDVSETDRFGRFLRYVYVEHLFINELLVKEGYAKASSYPPDVKYQERLRLLQSESLQNQKGLWGAECL